MGQLQVRKKQGLVVRCVPWALLAAGLGCSVGGEAPSPTPVPPTSTPKPTATTEPTATRTPRPTADAAATAAAEETEIAELTDRLVRAQLAEIDRENRVGQVDFFFPDPYELVVDTFNSYTYVPLDPGREYSDFILHYDVTWDSKTGLAGCGVIFRSEEDLEEGEQFRFEVIRLSGFPGWDVVLFRYGEFVSSATSGVRQSSAINQESGSTNEVFLEVDGTVFTAFANGTKLGSATVSRRSQGEIALFVWQESGRTSCLYENIWVFSLTE